MSRSRHRAILILAFALPACVTVNIYFPAPEVRRAAEQIVEETWGGAEVKVTTPQPGESGPSSWLDRFGPASAWAQQPDINVSTAAIRALKESMRKRAEDLKPYLRAGNVGIGSDGMLVVRNTNGVALRQQADIRRMVDAENRDRMSLYGEIAKANNFGENRVNDIKRIFAATWIEKAEPGWPIQKPDGSWTKK